MNSVTIINGMIAVDTTITSVMTKTAAIITATIETIASAVMTMDVTSAATMTITDAIRDIMVVMIPTVASSCVTYMKLPEGGAM